MRLLPVFALALACGSTGAMVACGSTTIEAAPAVSPEAAPPDMTQDEGGVADADVAFPAAHSAMPQVVTAGGPVLATPKMLPVFFPGTAYRTQVVDFSGKLGKSAYWKAVATEYGVGALSALAPIDIVEAPDAIVIDADIQTWLQSRFDGTHPEFGTTPVAGAIYALYYPPTTTIYLGAAPTTSDAGTDGGTHGGRGQASCKSFGGYHQDVKVNGVSLSYAVIPECSTFGPLKGADVITGTSSHEVIEAATDPFVISHPAYNTVDDDHISWQFALGAGEVGDMCAQYDTSFYKDAEIGYTVQRSWSNVAAAAGKDPCVPAPATALAYFNTAPRLPDDITLAGGAATTKGITIPVGMSKTIELDLFSSGATTGPWAVAVGATGGSATPSLTFALDTTKGVNGDKLHVTITSTSAVTSRLGATTFIVTSTLGNEKHFWAGVVGN